MLEYKVFVSSLMNSNSYLVFDTETRDGIIIDCGGNAHEIIAFAAKNKLSISHIILTHGHFDHTIELPQLCDAFSTKICIHKEDVVLLRNAAYNLSAQFMGVPFSLNDTCCELTDGSIISFGPHAASIIHTPGHTPGSVCVQIDNMLFTGDTLFYDSIGNTTFPLGDEQTEISSIKNKLFVLSDDISVYPGHGMPTAIGREKKYNLYLR